MSSKPKVLVLCTGNSCRSQIADGFLRHLAGDKLNVFSAGIETHGLNMMAVETMREEGIDISHHTSNHVDEYSAIDFDFVITVCDSAEKDCPVFPSRAKKFHHNFPDPAKASGTVEEVKEQFRKVRQEIKDFCLRFINDNLS